MCMSQEPYDFEQCTGCDMCVLFSVQPTFDIFFTQLFNELLKVCTDGSSCKVIITIVHST
jgi:hypothetical protein